MKILLEDNYLLVIDKAAGLSTENGTSRHPSAEQEALDYVIGNKMGGEGASQKFGVSAYVRAVHRIDRAASGVLLFAKNKSTLTDLMGQFEQKQVEKVYRAVVEKHPPEAKGRLEHWLRRDESGKIALVTDKAVDGAQQAILRYKTLELRGDTALLEIKLETGRYHQIRAQMAHIGCPIVGDILYGGHLWREHQIKLQAARLRFRHPKSGENIVIESELPAEWAE